MSFGPIRKTLKEAGSYHRPRQIDKNAPMAARRTQKLPVIGAAPVCSRCAARGPTCCEPTDGVALAPLTLGDIDRIQSATGLSPHEFTTERPIDDEERAALEEQDPVLRGLVRDGQLVSLAKSERGACVFHARDRGCTLSYETRPLLCRRYPIVRRGSELSVSPGGACLAIEEAADMPALLISLGLSTDVLVEIDRQIRIDLNC